MPTTKRCGPLVSCIGRSPVEKKKENGKGKAYGCARPLLQGNNAETEVRQAVRERRGKKTGFKKKSTGSRGCLQSLHPQLLLHCQFSKEFELFVLNTVHFFFLLFFLRKTACGATAIEGDFQSACLLLSHGMKNHSKLRFHAATGERRMKLTSFFSLLSKIICKLFRSILNPQTCSFFFLYDRHLSLSVVR